MKQNVNFFDLSAQVIEQWKDGKSPSTTANYLTALRSLQKFTKNRKLRLGDISEPLMKAYEHWLREENVGLNTISCYMRSLRSIYHQLGGKGDPFEKVFTGMMKTEKRAITVESIRKIRQLSLPKGSRLELTRDIFLFSIYTLGMPFVDLAHLRRQNIKNGFIVYQRHKTHQPIHIPIEQCMLDIIGKYEGQSADYLFPIIQVDSRKTAYEQYKNALHDYNKRLKQLAARAGIKANLTSYVVRHTWASLAYEKNVELSVISKALGHTNPKPPKSISAKSTTAASPRPIRGC